MTAFERRADWVLALSVDLQVRNELSRQASPKLTARDVRQLVSLAERGDEIQRDTAYRFLSPILTPTFGVTPRRLSPAIRRRLVAALARDASRPHPRDLNKAAVGAISMNLLLSLDRPRAERLILRRAASRNADDAELQSVVIHLSSLQSPGKLAALRRLARRRGVVGDLARRYLEMMGHMGTRTLAAVGKAWRTHRKRDDLNRLYHAYLERVRPGSPLAPLLRIMGRPARRTTGKVVWATREPTPIMVSVLLDERGRVDTITRPK